MDNNAITLTLNLPDRNALFSAYMPFLQHGGLFVPTPQVLALGDTVNLQLSLLDEPSLINLSTQVAWLTPKGANNNRPQGVGLAFSTADREIKARIETLLGGILTASRPTHTM